MRQLPTPRQPPRCTPMLRGSNSCSATSPPSAPVAGTGPLPCSQGDLQRATAPNDRAELSPEHPPSAVLVLLSSSNAAVVRGLQQRWCADLLAIVYSQSS